MVSWLYIIKDKEECHELVINIHASKDQSNEKDKPYGQIEDHGSMYGGSEPSYARVANKAIVKCQYGEHCSVCSQVEEDFGPINKLVRI